jgi:hypothetical protein
MSEEPKKSEEQIAEDAKKPKKIVAVIGDKDKKASIKVTIDEDKKHFKQSNESY